MEYYYLFSLIVKLKWVNKFVCCSDLIDTKTNIFCIYVIGAYTKTKDKTKWESAKGKKKKKKQ